MKGKLRLRILQDTKGQDFIEYALMAGFIAVAVGAAMPNFIGSVSTIWSRIADVLTSTAAS